MSVAKMTISIKLFDILWPNVHNFWGTIINQYYWVFLVIEWCKYCDNYWPVNEYESEFSFSVLDFMPRRSQSNISPPQLTKFQHLTAAKPRKFSLMSFRSMRTQNTRSSKLDTMIPLRNTTDVPYSDDDVKKLQKSELFSLGYNECITCLHLTAYNCKTSPCHHVNDGDYCDELVRKISLVSIESSSSSESSFLTLPWDEVYWKLCTIV